MADRATKNRVTYGGEAERVDLDSERRNVLLLKLARQMALDEGGLAVRLSANFLSWAPSYGWTGSGALRRQSPAQRAQQLMQNAGIPFQCHRHRQAQA